MLSLTSVARVDLKVVVSYIHPFWHGTVGRSVKLEKFDSRWNWGSENIWQELKLPSCSKGMLTMSLSSVDKFLKTPPSFRELILQWWEGLKVIKLFSRKWNGKVKRGITNERIVLSWNLPKPLTSASTLSNFILKKKKRTLESDDKYLQVPRSSLKVNHKLFYSTECSLLMVSWRVQCVNLSLCSMKKLCSLNCKFVSGAWKTAN